MKPIFAFLALCGAALAQAPPGQQQKPPEQPSPRPPQVIVSQGTQQGPSITLNLQTAANYEGGKQQMAMVLAMKPEGVSMKPASVGDDAYYFVTGDQAGLLVKKGSVSFKVAVYAKMPLADKEAIELKLAKDVVAKL